MEVTGKFAKFLYLMIMLATIVVAIGSKFGFANIYDYSSFKLCDGVYACQGNQAVYRYSFALAVWFVAIAIGVRGHVDVHYSYWTVKVMAFAILIVAALFIPGTFFKIYAEFARVVSIVFLLLQIFIIIDSAYRLHEYLLNPTGSDDNGDTNNNCLWQTLYLIICLTLLLVALGGVIVMFLFYKCGLAQFFIGFTLVLSVCVTLYSVLDTVGVGLMVPSAVSGYATYLCWQSLHSMPDEQCNPQADAPDNIGMIIVGLAIASLSLVYTALSTSNNMARLFHQHATDKEGDQVVVHDSKRQQKKAKDDIEMNRSSPDGAAAGVDISGGSGNEEDPERANTELNRKNHWRFHWLMAMGAVYGAMLLTNWGSTQGGKQSANTDVSLESMWVKIISQWLTFALFVWTIVAPRVCPDRDFT